MTSTSGINNLKKPITHISPFIKKGCHVADGSDIAKSGVPKDAKNVKSKYKAPDHSKLPPSQ